MRGGWKSETDGGGFWGDGNEVGRRGGFLGGKECLFRELGVKALH